LVSHNPNVPSSVKVLKLLEKARTNLHPVRNLHKKTVPPLSFDIDIRERSPTAEEFADIIYMLKSSTYTVFLQLAASQSYKTHPTSAQSLFDMVQEDPNLMRWPILVNSETQEVALGQPMMKSMLATLVRKRDKKDANSKPKAPEPPKPRWTLPPRPPPWTDYD
jgi:arsenate reductase-like glutaredoxin family protein